MYRAGYVSRSNVDFIPNGQNKVISLGNWGNGYHKKFYDLSLHVAPINESIDLIARAFSSGVPYLKDEKTGELTQDDPFIQFILNPNKEQFFEEFSKEFIRNLFSGGYSYLEPSSENTAFTRRLDKLDSDKRPELRVLINDYIDYPSNDFNDFIYARNNKQQPKNFENIIPFWDEVQDPCNYRIGVSRLCSLKTEIDNIIYGGEGKKNKILQSGKFIGSPKTDKLGNQIGLQMDQPVNLMKDPSYKQRDFIEDEINAIGLARGKSIHITNRTLEFDNVMESIQDYSYDEETKEDRRTVKNTFGIPRELQNIGDDQSKYENRKEAYNELFGLQIIPLADNFTKTLQDYYIPKDSRKFILDYSHHPSYELVKKKEEEKISSQVDRLVMLYEKEVIDLKTLNQKLDAYGII